MKVYAGNISELLKQGRLNKLITQGELAKKIGIGSQVISNVERGYQSLNMRHIIKLSIILEIPLETFKRAMVKDYEYAISREVFIALDTANSSKLREARDYGGSNL